MNLAALHGQLVPEHNASVGVKTTVAEGQLDNQIYNFLSPTGILQR
jgi:hypothetical protein